MKRDSKLIPSASRILSAMKEKPQAIFNNG
jgi:hypothetical protein